MFFVLRAIEERHFALFQFLLKGLDWFAIFFKFAKIPFLELFPFARVVAKPFPKLRAGRNIFEPQVNACFFLGQASGPEPVHEEASTVLFVRFFIHPLLF